MTDNKWHMHAGTHTHSLTLWAADSVSWIRRMAVSRFSASVMHSRQVQAWRLLSSGLSLASLKHLRLSTRGGEGIIRKTDHRWYQWILTCACIEFILMMDSSHTIQFYSSAPPTKPSRPMQAGLFPSLRFVLTNPVTHVWTTQSTRCVELQIIYTSHVFMEVKSSLEQQPQMPRRASLSNPSPIVLFTCVFWNARLCVPFCMSLLCRRRSESLLLNSSHSFVIWRKRAAQSNTTLGGVEWMKGCNEVFINNCLICVLRRHRSPWRDVFLWNYEAYVTGEGSYYFQGFRCTFVQTGCSRKGLLCYFGWGYRCAQTNSLLFLWRDSNSFFFF